MFSKIFLLAVLFCAVVFANAGPPHRHHSSQTHGEPGDKVKAFIAVQKGKIQNFGARVGRSIEEVKRKIVAWFKKVTGQTRREELEQQVDELQAELAQLRRESEHKLHKTHDSYKQQLEEQEEKYQAALDAESSESEKYRRKIELLKELFSKDVNNLIDSYDEKISEVGNKLEKVSRS